MPSTLDPPDLITPRVPSPPRDPISFSFNERTGGGRTRAALVLSGGGANAAFQVGVLSALRERFRWSAVYGVSAGALNAVLVGQEREDALSDVWREAETLIERRKAWRFIYGLIFGTTGVYDNARLNGRVLSLIRERSFRIPTFVGYVNLVSSAYQLVGAHEKGFERAVLASAAIPLLFDQPSVQGEALADGGLRNSTPLADAIDAGHSRVVVISNRRRDLERSSDLSGFVSIFGRTLEILLHEIAENDVRQAARINYLVKRAGGAVNGYRHVDLSVIRPSEDLGDMLDFSSTHVKEAIAIGEMDGARYLRGL